MLLQLFWNSNAQLFNYKKVNIRQNVIKETSFVQGSYAAESNLQYAHCSTDTLRFSTSEDFYFAL